MMVVALLCPCRREELLLHYRVARVHVVGEPPNIQCVSCRA